MTPGSVEGVPATSFDQPRLGRVVLDALLPDGPLPEGPRRRLARSLRVRIAGADFEAERVRIWDAPGPRWFGPDDPIWRVHDDAAMFVGGLRALLLQSLHPVAMAAVADHSGYQSDPWGRLQRVSHFLAVTTYGPVPAAERSVAVVRAVHRRVRGTTPDGVAYCADDPDLLSWIHVAEVDSFLAAYQAFGPQPLDDVEADRYVAQTSHVAARLGVPEPPRSRADIAERVAAFRPALGSTPAARDAAALLLADPPLSGPARPGYRALAAGAVSLLPSWARAELGLPTLPIIDRLVARPLARQVLGTLRWALRAPIS